MLGYMNQEAIAKTVEHQIRALLESLAQEALGKR